MISKHFDRITNEVLGQLSHRNLSFDCNPVSARQLGGIIDLLVQDALNSPSNFSILVA
jgi:hypothetical protein